MARLIAGITHCSWAYDEPDRVLEVAKASAEVTKCKLF